MAEEFVPSSDADVPSIAPAAKSHRREAVRIIVVVSDPAITNVIFTLFVKEFAEIYEWSDPMPEPKTGKMMRVMTKYVNLD